LAHSACSIVCNEFHELQHLDDYGQWGAVDGPASLAFCAPVDDKNLSAGYAWTQASEWRETLRYRCSKVAGCYDPVLVDPQSPGSLHWSCTNADGPDSECTNAPLGITRMGRTARFTSAPAGTRTTAAGPSNLGHVTGLSFAPIRPKTTIPMWRSPMVGASTAMGLLRTKCLTPTTTRAGKLVSRVRWNAPPIGGTTTTKRRYQAPVLSRAGSMGNGALGWTKSRARHRELGRLGALRPPSVLTMAMELASDSASSSRP